MIALIVLKPTRTCGPRGIKRNENVGATIMKITAESLVSKTAPMIITGLMFNFI